MTVNDNNLIWIDLEMTGLNPETDRIIEIATVITDTDLNVVAEGPVIAVYQPEAILAGMDDWNQSHHSKSGLINRVKDSAYSEALAEAETLMFLKQYVTAGVSPICGNTVWQDRRFLTKYMPELEAYFHYRQLDVSTLKILAKMWAPDIMSHYTKTTTHQALQDIYDSINELGFYRSYFLKVSVK